MQGMEIFFVSEANLWNAVDQSQEMLFFDWFVLNVNFDCLCNSVDPSSAHETFQLQFIRS